MTLPGILPPDAGRAERAARDYAIAALSYQLGSAKTAVTVARDALAEASPWTSTLAEAADAMRPCVTESVPWRTLRARVALYLRWCRRVERGRPWSWVTKRGDTLWAWAPSADGFVRWAVPLWTLAPAHDPAMGPAERRNRRPKA